LEAGVLHFILDTVHLLHLICAAPGTCFLSGKMIAAFFLGFLPVYISGCSIFTLSEKLLDFSPEKKYTP